MKTIDISTLISCIASICHVYMKFPLKIKDSTFFSQLWENIGFWDVIQEILGKYRNYSKILKIQEKYRDIGSLDTLHKESLYGMKLHFNVKYTNFLFTCLIKNFLFPNRMKCSLYYLFTYYINYSYCVTMLISPN